MAALSAALGSPYGVSAAAWLPSGMTAGLAPTLPVPPLALIRIEDFARSVVYRLGRLQQDLARFGNGDRSWTRKRAGQTWRAVRDAAVLRHRPRSRCGASRSAPSARRRGFWRRSQAAGARGFLDWGGGLVWLAGPAPRRRTRRSPAALAAGGVWTLMRAPEALRAARRCGAAAKRQPLAAHHPPVKAAMDPHGILNPGRL